MRKLLFIMAVAAIVSCNNDADKTETKSDTSSSTAGKTSSDANLGLPYTARYSSSWSDDVSDADLKMVLMTYKDWADNNMSGLSAAMADTVEIDMSSGMHHKKTNSDLMKMWSTSRDSLSSVKIDMDAWTRRYSTDKKDGYVLVWYDEVDTYKDGRVDSASYHDINQIKDGKIVWYSQYKRPKK